MCRLLGFATAGSNTNLNDVLGMQNVRDFRNLSEIHNDGWGAALITVPDESPYRRDGGAPTPETGTAIYKTPSPPVMIRFSTSSPTLRRAAACGTCAWPAPTCR